MYIDNRLGYTKMLCIFDWELRKIESTKEFVDTLDTVRWSKMEKIGKFGQIFWLRIGWNENFIMQLAYGDKNLFYKFFHLLLKKFFVRSVISLSKARFCDFSHRGYGNGFFLDW